MKKVSTQEHWNRFWQQPDPRIAEQQHNHLLVGCLHKALGGVRDKVILEAGCGTALDSIEMSRQGGAVVACDYSADALHVAQEKSQKEGHQPYFVRGDIFTLPFQEETFDAIFHAGVLEHFRDPSQLLGEQLRILKKGGVLLVDVPQTYNLYTIYKAWQIRRGTWFAGWETQYSIKALEKLIESTGFRVEAAYGHGYYPTVFAKVRWATSIGKGFLGRPVMSARVAEWYERLFCHIERTRLFLYFAQNIGIVARKPDESCNLS